MQQKMGGWGMSFDALPLGDLLSKKGYIRGPFGSALKRQELKQSGIPVYEQQQAIDGQRRFRFFIDQEKHNELRRFTVRANDLIISCSGTVGRVSVIGEGDPIGIISQALLILRPDVEKLLPRFLYYFLTSPAGQASLLAASHGAVQLNIAPRAVVEKILTPTPRIEEQRAIISVLGSLDDRITLLRETNATLEAIAQALFKSWFVDFDPVRAKMEGRPPAGMDEATAALFPGSFEESELGLVPRGWRVQALDEIATYLNGLALQKFPATGHDDLPVIKIAQLRKGDSVGADMASRSIKPEYVIQNGDVLFSWSGSLEVEIWCGGEGALNQHLFKVTSSKYPKWFYYLWTRHHLEHFRQVAASKATTMGHIQRAHLSAAKAFVPTENVLLAANIVLSPIIERQIENSLQAQTLSTLRDTLLPRLISGQLRLREAEQQVEEALA